MRSRLFYIGLNLIAPGIGQLALRWYVRGAIELLLSFITIIWSFMELFMPIINILSGNDNDGQITINFSALFLSIFILIIVWLWSIIEIILFYKKKNIDTGDITPLDTDKQ
jgi:hypothetical protein